MYILIPDLKVISGRKKSTDGDTRQASWFASQLKQLHLHFIAQTNTEQVMLSFARLTKWRSIYYESQAYEDKKEADGGVDGNIKGAERWTPELEQTTQAGNKIQQECKFNKNCKDEHNSFKRSADRKGEYQLEERERRGKRKTAHEVEHIAMEEKKEKLWKNTRK